MKKIELIILASFIFCAVLTTFAKIATVTLFATGGDEYSQITAQQKLLEKENVNLNQQVLTYSSFAMIASEAASLGFAYNNKGRMVLSDPAPMAYKQ